MVIQGKNLISIGDFSKEECLKVLELTQEFEQNPRQNILNNYIIATLFFEPSTRTRLSFESAVLRLGGKIIGFSDAKNTSVKKGETLHDTIKTIESYCDLIIMRHPIDGSSRYAGQISKVPVINAGDGANQHPTQTLLDLYSIKKTQNKLENLKIAFVGDLKYGRTVHSLVKALSNFNCQFYFISPPELKIPTEIKMELEDKNIIFEELSQLEEVLPEIDILYVTRIQKERFSDEMEYEKVKGSYILKKSMLENVKTNLKIMHPLPRVNEISTDIDETKYAYYFKQAENGVYVRQAIVALILGEKK